MAHLLECPVIEKKALSQGNYVISVRAPEVARECRPGQFVMISDCTGSSLPFPLLKRALAVYSVTPERGEPCIIDLLLKVVGQGTSRLASLETGDSTSVIGPLGNGFDLAPARAKTNVVVAGGTGIASVYLLTRRLLEGGEDVRLAYGGRSRADLVCLDDFRNLGMPVQATTEDGSFGIPGLVTEALRALTSGLDRDRLNLFTCGPNAMMKAVSRFAEDHDIPCQISVEVRMGCGFGVCLGCSVKTVSGYQLACCHGPVFQSRDFIWEPNEIGIDASGSQATGNRSVC